MKQLLFFFTGLCFVLNIYAVQAHTTIDSEPTNNHYPGADLLTMPANNQAHISVWNDVDFFKISATRGGVLVVNLIGIPNNLKLRIEIFDQTGTIKVLCDATATTQGASVSSEALITGAGDYYIKISNIGNNTNTNPYTLTIDFDISDNAEYNNTILSAFMFPINTTRTAKIRGYEDPIWCTTDLDYYLVQPTQPGVLTVSCTNVPANLKLRIEILDATGSNLVLCNADALAPGADVVSQMLIPTTSYYFIKIYDMNANTNANAFNVSVLLDVSDTCEYNNSFATAHPIPLTGTINPKIKGYENVSCDIDKDYFLIQSNHCVREYFTITNVSPDQMLRLTVFDNTGTNALLMVTSATNGAGITDSLDLKLGAYYIEVTDLNSNSSDIPYALVLSNSPNVPYGFAGIDKTICPNKNTTLGMNPIRTGTSYAWNPSNNLSNAFISNPIANPTFTTKYAATATFNGCSVTDSVLVTVNPKPVIPIVTGPLHFCQGDTITLTSSANYSNVWTTGDTTQSIKIFTGQVVRDTVYNSYGCYAVSAPKFIVMDSLPNVVALCTPSTTVCAGNSVTLAGFGASFFTWTGGATNGQPFVPTTSSTYIVTGTDLNNCINKDTINITVNPKPAVPAITGPSNFCEGDTITLTSSAPILNAWTTGDTTQSIKLTTSLTLADTVYNNFGCYAVSAAKTVTMHTLPNVGAVAIPANTICSGRSVRVNGTGAVVYVWTGGVTNGVPFLPTATTTYTVTGFDANNCKDTASTSITVLPSPSRLTAVNGATITALDPNATYQWIDCVNKVAISGANTQAYTATVSGTYAVVLTLGSCVDTSDCVTILFNHLNYAYLSPIFAYPNPTNGLTNLIFPKVLQNASIKLFNLTGQAVVALTNQIGSTSTLDLSALPQGVYMLEIVESNNVWRGKVVKQ